MAEKFDPYHKWLGIPPAEQPANHYRLLGLPLFEASENTISLAARQRIAHLNQLQTEANAAVVKKLIKEITAASACLLNPETKAAYDAKLRQPQPTKAALALPATAPQPRPAMSPTMAAPPSNSRSTRPKRAPSNPLSNFGLPVIAAAVTATSVLVLGLILSAFSQKPPAPGIAQPPAEMVLPSETPVEQPVERLIEQPAVVTPTPVVPVEPPQPPPANNPPPVTIDPAASPMAPTTVSPPEPTVTNLMPSSQPADIPLEPDPEPTAPVTAEDAKLELPNEEALAAARTEVLNIHGAEAKAATKPEDKQKLAHKMNRQAREANEDPATRYVLYDNARKMFAGAGAVSLAKQVTREMGNTFRFEKSAYADLLVATFTSLSDAPLREQHRQYLEDDLAVATDNFVRDLDVEHADQCSILQLKVVARLNDTDLKKAASEQRAEVTKLKNEYTEYKRALTTLETSPENSAANLTVGKFLCGLAGDWKQGRKHFAAAGVASLKIAVDADFLAEEVTSDEEGQIRFVAGNEWYEFAAGSKTTDTELINIAKLRAKYWYDNVLEKLNAKDRYLAHQRVIELADVKPQLAPGAQGPASARAPTKSVSSVKVGGMYGRLFINHQPHDVVLNYSPGSNITSKQLDSLLPNRRSGERLNIALEGFLDIKADGKYIVHLEGGPPTGGVNTVHIDQQWWKVGENGNHSDSKTVTLTKGTHSIRFEMESPTGGTFSIRLPKDAPPGLAAPHIYSKQSDVVELRKAIPNSFTLGMTNATVVPSHSLLPPEMRSPMPPNQTSSSPPKSKSSPAPNNQTPPATGAAVTLRETPAQIIELYPQKDLTTSADDKPGLLGTFAVDGKPPELIITYPQTNMIIIGDQFKRLYERLRITTKPPATITLEGTLVIAADGRYQAVHACDLQPNADFNLTVNGSWVSRHRNGNTENIAKVLVLKKGNYAVRWELKGTEFGEARLDFRKTKGMAAEVPEPKVVFAAARQAELSKTIFNSEKLGHYPPSGESPSPAARADTSPVKPESETAQSDPARTLDAIKVIPGGSSGGDRSVVEGWEFRAKLPLTVTHLGLLDFSRDGLTVAHDVAIWDVEKATKPIVSATIPAGKEADLADPFRVVPVEPVRLKRNGRYVIVAHYDENSIDTNLHLRSPEHKVDFSIHLEVFGRRFGQKYPRLAFPDQAVPGTTNIRIGPTFRYER